MESSYENAHKRQCKCISFARCTHRYGFGGDLNIVDSFGIEFIAYNLDIYYLVTHTQRRPKRTICFPRGYSSMSLGCNARYLAVRYDIVMWLSLHREFITM